MIKLVIYLDILGFKDLPKEIASKTGFAEDIIRQDRLSNPLKEHIEEIKGEKVLITKGISEIEGSDNYLLVVDEIRKLFQILKVFI